MSLESLDIEHHFGGGVYAKQTRIPQGVELIQHKHLHEHLSILASGSVTVSCGDVTQHLVGPACITIGAGLEHKVSALKDSVWYCIHASDETDPDKIDQGLIL